MDISSSRSMRSVEAALKSLAMFAGRSANLTRKAASASLLIAVSLSMLTRNPE
jgi:hypothetical protein